MRGYVSGNERLHLYLFTLLSFSISIIDGVCSIHSLVFTQDKIVTKIFKSVRITQILQSNCWFKINSFIK